MDLTTIAITITITNNTIDYQQSIIDTCTHNKTTAKCEKFNSIESNWLAPWPMVGSVVVAPIG